VVGAGHEEPLVFLMVHGQAREGDLVVLIHDADRGVLLEGVEGLAFEPDGRVGTVREPWRLAARPVTGAVDPSLPTAFALVPRFGNPLRVTETARLGFALPVAAHVSLRVFDVQGREVLRLVDETRAAGWHEAAFDPSRLASGAYFYRIDAGSFSESGKVILVK
jgi:hypothetical protein